MLNVCGCNSEKEAKVIMAQKYIKLTGFSGTVLIVNLSPPLEITPCSHNQNSLCYADWDQKKKKKNPKISDENSNNNFREKEGYNLHYKKNPKKTKHKYVPDSVRFN